MKFLNNKSSKLLSLLLCLVLVFSFCACSAEEPSGSNSVPEQVNQQEEKQEEVSEPVNSEDELKNDDEAEPDNTESSESQPEENGEYVEYFFRSKKLLNQHYEKHGIDMGFDSAKSYEKAASDVINNDEALSKTEKEDGDLVFYIEATNEFVVLSGDGYIRTYFLPDAGKKYYDKQ